MSILDQFERETIIIRLLGAERRVLGWRFREFHLNQRRGGTWAISHVPTGMCAAHEFSTIESAAKAAIEIDRLRNSWSDFARDERASNTDKIEAICVKFGGRIYDPKSPEMTEAARQAHRCDLNGYAEARA